MKTATLILLLLAPFFACAQDEDAPYLKNPVLPGFSILKQDSTSWITEKNLRTGAPVIVMLFSPDCDHCKEQTEILLDNMDKLQHVDIVMTTFQPISKIKEFQRKYRLGIYKNIYLGRDVKFFFAPFYRIKYAPFLAIYNRQHKLVKTFEGDTKFSKLLEWVK